MEVIMKSTYLDKDVTLLLKDISGLVPPLSTLEREKQIQNGVHYSEMLPLEYRPSVKYMEAYEFSLQAFARHTANAVCQVSEKIYSLFKNNNSKEIVLVSLARAGILIKRYLEKKYNISIAHYAVSIIRGRGIDTNAIDYILSMHNPESIQFVDGWIGKGAIQRELDAAMFSYPKVSTKLAVLSDPANITDLCGTHEDILIPSSCLNSTVSGLLSRTFLRQDIIKNQDFHGAAFYSTLLEEDISYTFIDTIENHFDYNIQLFDTLPTGPSGLDEVNHIAKHYNIQDINLIKPGIGEATRVLLRRVPWKLLLKPDWEKDPLLHHLIQLAKEKKVSIEEYDLRNYKACGIIQNMCDA